MPVEVRSSEGLGLIFASQIGIQAA